MTFKQIVRAIAMRNGLHASFLPKPLPQQAGSGLHINLSLYMDGKNLFEGDIAPDSVAGSFMAGVLAHSRELTVFTNPLPNSYQRFGCDEAPPLCELEPPEPQPAGAHPHGQGRQLPHGAAQPRPRLQPVSGHWPDAGRRTGRH